MSQSVSNNGWAVTTRTPKKWTKDEDDILLRETEAQVSRGKFKDWHRIAATIPGRNNKDCRKRWCKINGEPKKGLWEPDEDNRLQAGVHMHGFRWTLVSQEVETRNADQCAKRWQHSIDPSLDRSNWTPEDDDRIRTAVDLYGRDWKKIKEAVFPSRSRSHIKNRYATLIRRRRPDRSPARSDHSWSGDEDMTESDTAGDMVEAEQAADIADSDLAGNMDWTNFLAAFPQGLQTSLSMPTPPGQNPAPHFGSLSGSPGLAGSPAQHDINLDFCPSPFQGGRPSRQCDPSWPETDLPWLQVSTGADSSSCPRQLPTPASSFSPSNPTHQTRTDSQTPYSSAPSLVPAETPGEVLSSAWTAAGKTRSQGRSREQSEGRGENLQSVNSKRKCLRRSTQTTLVLDDLDPATMANIMHVLRQSETRATVTFKT